MVDCVRELLDWADIAESGDPRDLIILGGGTLINRRTYLRWVSERDSPRVERATLGTGAQPRLLGPDRGPRPMGSLVVELRLCRCPRPSICGNAEVVGVQGRDGDLWRLGASRHSGPPRRTHRRSGGGGAGLDQGELWGGSDHEVIEAMAGAIEHWKRDGREVVCLASSPEDDGQILQLSRATGNQVLPYLAGYVDNQAAIDLIASAEVVVGERLHACVLAAAVSTPFIGIEYRPKLRDFAESVDRGDLVVRTDTLSVGRSWNCGRSDEPRHRSRRRPGCCVPGSTPASLRLPAEGSALTGPESAHSPRHQQWLGLGHLTRQLAIALAIGDRAETTMFSLSPGFPLAMDFGIRGEYCPSFTTQFIVRKEWDNYLQDRLAAFAEEVQPDVLLFDGVAPYSGFMRAIAQLPDCVVGWLRRGMWRGSNEHQLQKTAGFDFVIEPTDLASDIDTGATIGAEALRVPPISLLEVMEQLDRETAARSSASTRIARRFC